MKVRVNTNDNDCYSDETIICPYCSHHFSDPSEYGENQDGETIECQACGRKFVLSVYVSTTYTSKPVGGSFLWERGEIVEDGLTPEEEERANRRGLLSCFVEGACNDR